MNKIFGAEKKTKWYNTNKVFRQRAIQLNWHNLDFTVKNASSFGPFTGYDKHSMEMYKKIYHYGVDELNRFFGYLEQLNGNQIPPQSQLYFIKSLLKGPFKDYAYERVASARILWRRKSDVVGITGDRNNRTHLQTPFTVYEYDYDENACEESIVTRNKIPPVVWGQIRYMTYLTRAQDLINKYASLWWDDTQPGIDKKYKQRLSDEKNSDYHFTAHAQRQVADVTWFKDIIPTAEVLILGEDIYAPITPKSWSTSSSFDPATSRVRPLSSQKYSQFKDDCLFRGYGCAAPQLAEGGGYVFDFYEPRPSGSIPQGSDTYSPDYDIYRFLKHYNPFSTELNKETAFKAAVKKKFEYQIENLDTGEISHQHVHIRTDLFGNTYDSDRCKSFQININNKSYALYTVNGQLGHGEPPKKKE